MKNKKGDAFMTGVIFVTVFIVAVIVILMGVDSVDANHLGVMVELGKIKGVMDPGVAWTGVFTHTYEYDMRTRNRQVTLEGANSALDKTGQAVYATINLNYRIRPNRSVVLALYENVGNDDVIEQRLNLEAIVREGFKQATVMYEALEIVEKRQDVKELAIENIRKNFPGEYFELETVIVSNIDFNQAFKDAIESKKVAVQMALQAENQVKVVENQQKQLVAMADANKTMTILNAEASAEQVKLAAGAQAASVRVVAEAEADATRLKGAALGYALREQRDNINQLLVEYQYATAWKDKWAGDVPAWMMTSSGAEGNGVSYLMQVPENMMAR